MEGDDFRADQERNEERRPIKSGRRSKGAFSLVKKVKRALKKARKFGHF